MHFPRHWAKATAEAVDAVGTRFAMSCWRWSEASVAEARELAAQAAQLLATRVARTGELPRGQYYADRPLREEVLRRVEAADGTLLGLVTRNAYGCEVLNTEQVMFVDVDLPEPQSGASSLLSRLFGARKAQAPAELEKIRAFVKARPAWGFRVYRTRAGLRLLATHAQIVPESPETRGVFEALGADPLYVKLCKAQASYRARLTPKPWRIEQPAPHQRWPFEDSAQERAFTAWLTAYENIARAYATCAFVEAVGSSHVDPAIATIVALHDQATGVGSDKPLA
jgi:hypothetical protein